MDLPDSLSLQVESPGSACVSPADLNATEAENPTAKRRRHKSNPMFAPEFDVKKSLLNSELS